MHDPLQADAGALASKLAAPQHRPRPLPLFLDMVRREIGGNAARLQAALAGLRLYQQAMREPPSALPRAIASAGCGAMLRDYGGTGPPIVFIPSLINPPGILDLSAERSLLRWLAANGHRPLLLDWGEDAQARRSLSIGGHVEDIVLPLIETLGEPPALVGYCLGGTMAVAAAALTPVTKLATIAAPWHFSGFPAEARKMLLALWRGALASTQSLGVLPMEILQSAFWSLDPARSVAKFEAFSLAIPGSDAARAFVALEDWANDGPPMSEAAAREMFEDLFEADRPGSGGWRVGGKRIDPAALACPTFHIVSTTDRIVPHATAISTGERLDLARGHVGMVVGRHAEAGLWRPLSAWLSRTGPT